VVARRHCGAAQLVVPLPAPRQGACDGPRRLSRCFARDARDKAEAARTLLADDFDPINRREADRQADAVKEAQATTFTEAAQAYIEAHVAGWRNDKHAAQWRSTIKSYAEPVLGQMGAHGRLGGLPRKAGGTGRAPAFSAAARGA